MKTELTPYSKTPAEAIAKQIKILMEARAAIDKAIQNAPQYLTYVTWSDVWTLAHMVDNVKRAELVQE